MAILGYYKHDGTGSPYPYSMLMPTGTNKITIQCWGPGGAGRNGGGGGGAWATKVLSYAWASPWPYVRFFAGVGGYLTYIPGDQSSVNWHEGSDSYCQIDGYIGNDYEPILCLAPKGWNAIVGGVGEPGLVGGIIGDSGHSGGRGAAASGDRGGGGGGCGRAIIDGNNNGNWMGGALGGGDGGDLTNNILPVPGHPGGGGGSAIGQDFGPWNNGGQGSVSVLFEN